MDVVADLPTNAQSPEPMEQGKRLPDDPAVLAQPGAVFGAAPGDDRRDTHRPNLLAILVVVVGTVGIHVSSRRRGRLLRPRTADVFRRLLESLEDDTPEWRMQIPGKPLLGKLAAAAGVHPSRARNLYLRAAQQANPSPFQEVLDIFQHFAAMA